MEVDYSKGKYQGHIMKLAMPLVLFKYVAILNSLIDMVVTARVSAIAVSATTSVIALKYILRDIYGIPMYDLVNNLGKVYGAGDKDEIGKKVKSSAVCLGVVIMVLPILVYMSMDKVLSFISITEVGTPELYGCAREYYVIYLVPYVVYRGIIQ